ncbi:MAG: T9SS type A sorting domain-containing protein [Candidatus Latescibacteria bacterium]|nr:T9SS type A sorting domain-containing protein [Candidatus Latescibacterota bacterium]
MRQCGRFLLALAVFATMWTGQAFGQNGDIHTAVGGGIGDAGPATAAVVRFPEGVTVDDAGNVYIADSRNHAIRRINTGGSISTVAGTGGAGYSGDGGLATAADLNGPQDVFWLDGVLYIADSGNDVIRKVVSGVISTIAGDGTSTFDEADFGLPATQAGMHFPTGVFATTDEGGTEVYITLLSSSRVVRIDDSGNLQPVAGSGVNGTAGDGGLATAAELRAVWDVAVSSTGVVYIADSNRIRRISGGTITSVLNTAGATPTQLDPPSTGLATSSAVNTVKSIVVDGSNIYFTETGFSTSRVASFSVGGLITTEAGVGTSGYSGDGGLATAAQVNNPSGLAMDGSNNLYLGDRDNFRVRKVVSGVINTIGGVGSGFLGEGVQAETASLFHPQNVAVDAAGNIFIADSDNHRIRKVDTNGDIFTIAGTGTNGDTGDGGFATAALISNPRGLAIDSQGHLYMALVGTNKIKMIDSNGNIQLVAGGGSDFSEDIPATQAQLSGASRIAFDGGDNLYILDRNLSRIRRVAQATQMIQTVAGGGVDLSNGVPGTTADLNFPNDLIVDSDGSLIIAAGGGLVRRIGTDGNINTIGGGGEGTTDGIQATTADLGLVNAVTVDATGQVYVVSDKFVKKIDGSGVLTTVAGVSGSPFGDGGPATAAKLSDPVALAIESDNDLLIADKNNHRIRRVINITSGPVTPGGTGNPNLVTGNVNEMPGVVTTLAGSGSSGDTDGSAGSATFNEPTGVAIRGGQLFVADAANHKIRVVNLFTGAVSTFAGSGSAATTDGTGLAAAFNTPVFIKSRGDYLYVAEEEGHVIRKIDINTGAVTTLAGLPGASRSSDGTGTTARFNEPHGMAVTDDYLYVADGLNHKLRKIDLQSGAVTTVVGLSEGDSDGQGSTARLREPIGVVAKGDYLYITDAGNHKIKKVNRNTYDVTTIAGSTIGFADGIGTTAAFNWPAGIDISGNNLIIGDNEGHRIRKLNIESNEVSTVAGSGVAGFQNGTGTFAQFDTPADLVIGPAGNIYVGDENNNRIRRIRPLQALNPRTVKIVLAVEATATLDVPILGLQEVSVTVPIDSGTIELGVDSNLGAKDLSSFRGGPGDIFTGDLIQPFIAGLEDLSIRIPDENIGDTDGVTLRLTIRNIDVTDGNNPRVKPIVVDGDTIDVFFFLTLEIEKDGVVFDRFDFREGAPMILRVPVGALTTLLANSGFGSVGLSDLTLAFLDSDGRPDRDGIFGSVDPSGESLVVAVTHLSDIVGINKNDIPPPREARITAGPIVEPDTTFATVAWRTSEPTNTALKFGTSISALSDTVEVESDSLGVQKHILDLTGLTKATTYYFQICAEDPFGRTFASAIDSFRTRGIPDVAAPVFVVFPGLRERSSTTAGFFMRTDRRTTIVANYDTAGASSLSQLAEDNEKRKNHLLTLSDLTPGTNYQVVFNATGSETVSSDTISFRTRANADTLPPVFRLRRVDDFATTDSTAIVSLVANFPIQMEVFYWEADSTDTLSEVVSDPSTSPFVILTDLKAKTKYVYFVKATRQSNGKTAISPIDRFRTRRPGRIVPLRFTNAPSVGYRSNNRVVFRWRTNIPSTGFVYFQLDPSGTGIFDLDEAFIRGSDDFTKNHRVTLPGLIPGERYLVVVTSTSPDGQFLTWPPDTEFSTAPKVINGKLFITGIVQVPGSNGRFTTNTQPDTQAPIILNGPAVVAQTDDQLVVQWETDELSSSQVDFGTSGILSESATSSDQVTLHQLTLTNLSPNTAYDFTVSSIDPSSNGPTVSTQAVGLTVTNADATPPVIDAASIASAPSDDRAIITWLTDEGSDSEVQFGTDADSLETAVVDGAIVTSHQVTLTGLTPSTKYFFKVLSSDVAQNGPTTSATFSLTTSATPDTETPVISNVANSTSTQPDSTATITLTWSTDRLASSFVDYDTLSDLSTQVTTGTQNGSTSHSVTVTGLDLGRTYYFQVGSENVLDQSVPRPQAKSDLDSVGTPTDVDLAGPNPPATATAVPGNGAVLVRWDASTDPSGIKGYNITRNGVTISTNVSDIELVDPTVTNDTAYTYTVTAIDNAGNVGSTATSTSAVTPATAQIAAAPTATSPAAGDTVSVKPILVLANGTPVPGDPTRATLTYTFQVATDAGFSSIIANKDGIAEGSTGNPTNWQVLDLGQPDSTALADGVTYYWRSRANDGSFDGEWSTSETFVASVSKPTSVTLATMAAESDHGLVIVTWSIGHADPGLLGFHVLRSLSRDSGFERLTDDLLTGEETYEFRDAAVQVKQQYFYMIEALSANGEMQQFGPISLRVNAPNAFALKQNAPNPFNPATTIRFDLPNPTRVSLIVYNVLGQEVIRLVDNESMEAGFHEIRWNGQNKAGRSTASGIYLYRIEAGEFSKARKMLLLK